MGPLEATASLVAPAEASATKMSELYLFAATFGAGLLASSWALTFSI
jgi:hypothetical protein